MWTILLISFGFLSCNVSAEENKNIFNQFKMAAIGFSITERARYIHCAAYYIPIELYRFLAIRLAGWKSFKSIVKPMFAHAKWWRSISSQIAHRNGRFANLVFADGIPFSWTANAQRGNAIQSVILKLMDNAVDIHPDIVQITGLRRTCML